MSALLPLLPLLPLLTAEGLSKEFQTGPGLPWRRRPALRAIAGVDLAVARGECVGVVGESGSGKTTLGRCLIRLVEPTAGRVSFDGEDLLGVPPALLRRLRRRFQMVFQDPFDALDPRQRVGAAVGEPLAVHFDLDRGERRRRVEELLELVGLSPEQGGRLPHQLSGGERQRVGIARALAPSPDLVVADEPVSSLDVSVRGQILNLLAGLRSRFGLALVLISHDLPAVAHLADRVAVLYLGRIVELAPAADFFARPLHPYSACLLAAAPGASLERRGLLAGPPGLPGRPVLLRGEPPSPTAPPPGCPFHPRCPIARPRCATERPPLAPLASPPAPRDPAAQRRSREGDLGLRPPGSVAWPSPARRLGGDPIQVACFFPGEL